MAPRTSSSSLSGVRGIAVSHVQSCRWADTLILYPRVLRPAVDGGQARLSRWIGRDGAPMSTPVSNSNQGMVQKPVDSLGAGSRSKTARMHALCYWKLTPHYLPNLNHAHINKVSINISRTERLPDPSSLIPASTVRASFDFVPAWPTS